MKLRRFVGRAVSALTLLAVPIAVAGHPGAQPQAQQQTPRACSEIDGFQRLDFWLGDWKVVGPDGSPQGTNRIEKVLDGCAIVERWSGEGGGRGMSLFYFNALNRTWKQVWVTSRATVAGALKEKQLIEELPGGGVRFQGVIVLADGRVRQVIEWSRDGGVNWTESFHGVYERSDDHDG